LKAKAALTLLKIVFALIKVAISLTSMVAARLAVLFKDQSIESDHPHGE
jgi:hypothetical protein